MKTSFRLFALVVMTAALSGFAAVPTAAEGLAFENLVVNNSAVWR